MFVGFIYPLLDAFWTILWIFGFALWIWLVLTIILDLFRDHEQSGWAKAFWVLLLVFLPIVGVVAYLIIRGAGMHARAVHHSQAVDEQARAYIREAAGTAGHSAGIADEIEKLARLRDLGVISGEEFERSKARLLS